MAVRVAEDGNVVRMLEVNKYIVYGERRHWLVVRISQCLSVDLTVQLSGVSFIYISSKKSTSLPEAGEASGPAEPTARKGGIEIWNGCRRRNMNHT